MYTLFLLKDGVKSCIACKDTNTLVNCLNTCVRFRRCVPAPESEAELLQYAAAAKHAYADHCTKELIEKLKKIYKD